MTTEDISSLDELISNTKKFVQALKDVVEEDGLLFKVETDFTDPSSQQAASDIENVSNGVISSEDYLKKRAEPGYTTIAGSAFTTNFEDTRRKLLVEASINIDGFLRRAMDEAIEVLTDIDAVLAEIQSEAAKLSALTAASMLIPPAREDVQDIRDKALDVYDVATVTVADLQSARAARTAAKEKLQTDPLVPKSTPDGHYHVEGRHIEPTESGYVTATDALALAPGRVSKKLPAATALLQERVLNDVAHIGICMAIASLDTQKEQKDRAERLFRRLTTIINAISEIMSNGFLATLQNSMQELAAKNIEKVTDVIKDKIDSIDLWLETLPASLPTFVNVVKSIGDKPEDTPLLDSLEAYCDLNMASFCDAQGLLETAKRLDAEIGKLIPRIPKLGRVSLLVIAPEAQDYNEVTTLPDQETTMFLVEEVTNDSTTVTARVKSASHTRSFTVPQPPIPGTLAKDSEANLLVITGISDTNVASLGTITIGVEVARYSGYEINGSNYTFTLIDSLQYEYPATSVVEVTGEHRDRFTQAFEPSANIRGGAGKLVLSGDGEHRETLTYSQSQFDSSTGYYTFQLNDAPTLADPPHKFTIVCRPHPRTKEILFKSDNILTLAERVNVAGNEITLVNSEANFLSLEFSDYDDGPYLLVPGDLPYGVELDSGSCTSTRLVLKETLNDQENVTLSRVRTKQPKDSTAVELKLSKRQKKDLLISDLIIGATREMSGRVILETGTQSSRVSATTTYISPGTAGIQMLTVKEPVLDGDEDAFQISMRSGQTAFTADISSVSGKDIYFEMPLKTGTVTIESVPADYPGEFQPRYVVGMGTSFTEAFKVDDHIYIDTLGSSKIVRIVDNEHLVVSTDLALSATPREFRICAPPGGEISISILRSRQETLEFSSITNADDDIYILTTEPTAFVHGLQDPELKETVLIVSDEIQGFLDKFKKTSTDDYSTVTPRFDGNTVPPGVYTVRAELEFPDARPIVNVMVLAAEEIIVGNLRLPVSSVNEDGDNYIFTLDNPLPIPLNDGQVIEVETTDLIDNLFNLEFSDAWTQPFDDFFRNLLSQLTILEKKICRILQGRPIEVGITAGAIATMIALIRPPFVTMRLLLMVLRAGLEPSPIIELSVKEFAKMGMDAAEEATKTGNVSAIAVMTSETSTSQGQALQSTQNYRQEVVMFKDAKIADSMASSLLAAQWDKEYLVEHRRSYNEIIKDQLLRKQNAAKVLMDNAETIT